MTAKKKICLVIPSLQAGGMERVMSELAGNFAARLNAEIHLILFGITREVFYTIPENVILHKPVFRFRNDRRLLSSVRTLIFLRSTIKEIDPFRILSFGEYWNNFLLLSLLGLSYPVIVSDRSQPDKSLGWFHDKIRHWLYPKAKGIILQTEKAKQIYLTKRRHSNIVVIGNPIGIPATNDDFELREKSILMVGRLIKTKHQDKLIEMFARVYRPDWKLVIVGYDHLKQKNLEKLIRLANELNVGNHVVFTGKQDNIEAIYRRSSIFAFTSSSEGFPNVIGEAMASGLPVIAFDCVAGPSEMIRDEYNGYLVPLFNYELFEERLSQLMANEELRKKLGKCGKESIKKFAREIICESFYKFITA